MGNWQLEVFRMAIYVSFPVGFFHYFNHSDQFAKWATELHEEIYPKEDPNFREEIKRVAKELRERKEQQSLKGINETNKQ